MEEGLNVRPHIVDVEFDGGCIHFARDRVVVEWLMGIDRAVRVAGARGFQPDVLAMRARHCRSQPMGLQG